MELLEMLNGFGAYVWQSAQDTAEAVSLAAMTARKSVGNLSAATLASRLSAGQVNFSSESYTSVAKKQRDAEKAWADVATQARIQVTLLQPIIAMQPARMPEFTAAQIALSQASANASEYGDYAQLLEKAAKMASAIGKTDATQTPPSTPPGTTPAWAPGSAPGTTTWASRPPGGSDTFTDTSQSQQNCALVGGTWDYSTSSCLMQTGDSGGDPFPIAKKFPTALVVGGLAAVGLVAYFLLRKPRGGVAGYYGDDDDRASSFAPGLGHGGYLDRRGGHSMWALSPITGKRYSAGYHWHRPSGWRSR